MGERIDPRYIGEAFQRYSTYPTAGGPAGAIWTEPVSARKPPEGVGPPFRLPEPAKDGGMTLWGALSRRCSTREYVERRPLTAPELSQLLWAGQGAIRTMSRRDKRTVPTAAGAYPIETYIAVHSVEGLEAGLYHHDVREHSLMPLRRGNLRGEVATMCQGQAMCANAAVAFIWTAVVGRTVRVCSQRGYRYIYLEVGHIAQNVALAAAALGLGSCQVGGFYDELAVRFLGVDSYREPVLYVTVVAAAH